MSYEDEKVQLSAAEKNTPAAETTLQIEELESRIAPNVVWGD